MKLYTHTHTHTHTHTSILIKENKKGITLIALVITIIVLLILAGVTIVTLTGENGLLGRAKVASEETKYANEKESLQLLLLDIKARVLAEEKRSTEVNDCNELNGKDGVTSIQIENIEKPEYAIVIYNGYKFKINNDLIIIDENKNEYDNSIELEKANLVLLEHFNENLKANSELIDENLLNTVNKKIGNASLYLNETTITNNNTEAFKFVADFTIDFWLNPSNENLTNYAAPVLTVKNDGGIWIGFLNGKFIIKKYNAPDNLMSVESPAIGEWTHIAICRKDGIIYLFYNGILQNSIADADTLVGGTLYIGTDGYNNYAKNTYIDELRILDGVAKWNTNFEVKNNEYSSEDGIVYHFDYYKIFQDTAEINTSEKKFGNGAKYFNDTGILYTSKEQENYEYELDFTIDYWIKISDENLTGIHPIMGGISTTAGPLWMHIMNGKFAVRDGEQDIVSLNPPATNEWTHIAICRKDGIIYVFYNGILQGTVSYNKAFLKGTLVIGMDIRGNYLKNSYIDELRIIDGYGRWTDNFSVPTDEYNY